MAGFPVNIVDPVTGLVTGSFVCTSKVRVNPPTQVKSTEDFILRDSEGVAYVAAWDKFGGGATAAAWLDEVADEAITTLIEPEE